MAARPSSREKTGRVDPAGRGIVSHFFAAIAPMGGQTLPSCNLRLKRYCAAGVAFLRRLLPSRNEAADS
jgi:hypothetical protein